MNPTHRIAQLCCLLVAMVASPFSLAQSLEISTPFGTSPIVDWTWSGNAGIRFETGGAISADAVQVPVIQVVRPIDDLSPLFFSASQTAETFALVVLSGGQIELELEDVIVQSVKIDTSVSPAMETISLVYHQIQYSFGTANRCWDYFDNQECP